jgi:nucleotide-binding universal stress UspA family protein
MYKNILVPLDGSKRAERILPHAVHLAGRFNAGLILVHVVEPHIDFYSSLNSHKFEEIEDLSQQIKQAKAYLNELKDQLEAEGHQVENQVVHGNVVRTILRMARKFDSDLIAIASHGRTGLSRVFYDSIAAGVLHQVNRPLLIIRAEDDEEQEWKDVNMYKNILIPLDGSKRAERILPHVEQLALHFGSSVILLRIVELIGKSSRPHATLSGFELENVEQRFDGAKSYLAAIRGEFREKGVKAKAVINKGPVVKWICDVASSEDVDLIAMASHGHTGLERVFYGSVAAGVLHQVDRPLLLIRTRGDS